MMYTIGNTTSSEEEACLQSCVNDTDCKAVSLSGSQCTKKYTFNVERLRPVDDTKQFVKICPGKKNFRFFKLYDNCIV